MDGPFELQEPAPAPPVKVAPLEPVAPATLCGIDWAEVAAEARGEVAMFEVSDPGTLQQWGRRGDA